MLPCDPIAHENRVVEFSFSARLDCFMLTFFSPLKVEERTAAGSATVQIQPAFWQSVESKETRIRMATWLPWGIKIQVTAKVFENYPLHLIKGCELETPVTGLRRISGKAAPKAFDVKHRLPFGTLRAANTSRYDSIWNRWQLIKAAETPHGAAGIWTHCLLAEGAWTWLMLVWRWRRL